MSLKYAMTSQLSHANGVKVLVYSDAGIGKTVLTATAPYPILISAESGTLSLSAKNLTRLYGANNPGITYDIPTITIQNVDDLTNAYMWLMQAHEARSILSVCVDSISEIAEVVLNNAKRQVKDPRQAYGELIEKMETTIRAFRDMPGRNVYMSAKMEPMKDELTGVVRFGPAMPGSKLGPKLSYFFDEVFHMGVNKDTQGKDFRYLRTQPDLQYVAKDRSGALAMLEPPHLGNIFAKIAGG